MIVERLGNMFRDFGERKLPRQPDNTEVELFVSSFSL